MKKDISTFLNATHGPTEAERLAQKAKEALSDLVDTYLIQVNQDFLTMQNLLDQAYSASSENRFHIIRDDFFVKMHDLKGQGATFDYPILTEIGRFTCDFLRQKKKITLSDLDVLKDILSDVDLVLKNKLTDSGGKMGKEILDRLKTRKNG